MAAQTSSSNDSLLTMLATPAEQVQVPSSLPVSYKGVGRSSGDAPRVVKAILLSRLIAALGRDQVSHVGGDSYSTGTRQIAFRVTSTPHRTSLPWFNISAREVEQWRENNTAIVVVGIYPLKKRYHYTGIIAILPAEAFGDVAASPTKASEKQPSALFEIKDVRPGGIVLVNSTAKWSVRLDDIPGALLTKFNLSRAEARFLTAGYETVREPDPTSGGRIKPLKLLVDPGTAETDDIATFLSELSKLYRMVGGSGITFALTDIRKPSGVPA
jgi:hypothetical protein